MSHILSLKFIFFINDLFSKYFHYFIITIDIKHMDTAFLYTFYIHCLGQHNGERNDGSHSHTSSV